jgi:hypothetical protein
VLWPEVTTFLIAPPKSMIRLPQAEVVDIFVSTVTVAPFLISAESFWPGTPFGDHVVLELQFATPLFVATKAVAHASLFSHKCMLATTPKNITHEILFFITSVR